MTVNLTNKSEHPNPIWCGALDDSFEGHFCLLTLEKMDVSSFIKKYVPSTALFRALSHSIMGSDFLHKKYHKNGSNHCRINKV